MTDAKPPKNHRERNAVVEVFKQNMNRAVAEVIETGKWKGIQGGGGRPNDYWADHRGFAAYIFTPKGAEREEAFWKAHRLHRENPDVAEYPHRVGVKGLDKDDPENGRWLILKWAALKDALEAEAYGVQLEMSL